MIKPIHIFSRQLFRFNKQQIINGRRCINTDGQYMKTDVQLLTREEDDNHLYIHGYSPLGFSLNSGTQILGPIAIFPKTILHWNVRGAEDINEQSMALFQLLVPKLEIVVIGYGDYCDAKSVNNIFKFLKSNNINTEILPSPLACSTFNFLNLERRYVCAGIIPPVKGIDQKRKERPADWLEQEEKTVFEEEIPSWSETVAKVKKLHKEGKMPWNLQDDESRKSVKSKQLKKNPDDDEKTGY